MDKYNLCPIRLAPMPRLSPGSGPAGAAQASMGRARAALPATDYSSEMRSGDRMAGPSNRSVGIKETLSVSVSESDTARVSVSPASQTWGVLANSRARMAVRKGGDRRAALTDAAAGELSSGGDCAP